MSLQFDRTASVVIGNSEELEIRVQFNITQEMFAAGAGCEIKLFNLSRRHQGELEIEVVGKLGKTLTLTAGYGGISKVIYRGGIFYAKSERSGTDIITTCQMQPGAKAYQTVFVMVQGARTDYQILQACIDQFKHFGIVKGAMSAAVLEKLKGGSRSGFSDAGTASRFMDIITERHGFRWNIDNDELNIFAPDEYEDGEMILLNKDTGMIGIPAKTMGGNYRVKALLNADLRPGKKIRVESTVKPLNGDLKIFRATHVGDSKEGDWYTEVECYLIGTQPGFVRV